MDLQGLVKEPQKPPNGALWWQFFHYCIFRAIQISSTQEVLNNDLMSKGTN